MKLPGHGNQRQAEESDAPRPVSVESSRDTVSTGSSIHGSKNDPDTRRKVGRYLGRLVDGELWWRIEISRPFAETRVIEVPLRVQRDSFLERVPQVTAAGRLIERLEEYEERAIRLEPTGK